MFAIICQKRPTALLLSNSFTFNPFQENTYLLYTKSGDCAIVDPGCYGPSEQNELLRFISEHNLKPSAVWLTHAHVDHVLGLDFCCKHFGIKALLTSPEIPQLKAVELYAPNYGFYDYQPTDQLEVLNEAGILLLGGEEFQILSVPGHSPGHVAFYHPASSHVWAGDVLFRQSIGRTDLAGGNFDQLEKSIQTKMFTLPAETRVCPGHGPVTTIGFEIKNNPFVRPLSA